MLTLKNKTVISCQPVVDRRGGRRHGEERTGRTRSGRGGRQLLGVLEMKKWVVGGVGDEKVGVEDVAEKMFGELGDTWPR